MMVSPAAVSQVTNLQLKVFTKFRSTALSSVFFNFVLHLTRVKDIELEVWDIEYIS